MINSLKENLIKHIDHYGLPGELSHKTLLPYGRLTATEALRNGEKAPRLSAVLILLYPESGRIKNVLIKRPAYEGVHSGQMGFPGGRKEETDDTLWHTALRETEEEIGVQQTLVEHIHHLTPVYIPPSNYLVHPYLGVVEHAPTFIPDPREVESIHTFDVSRLKHDQVVKVTKVQTGVGSFKMNVPYFDLNDQVVWGATALILNELRELLIRMDIRS